MTPEQVDHLPMYLASIMMGAMSPDHTHLSMTGRDLARFHGMEKWRHNALTTAG
jgi:hypothetical protein